MIATEINILPFYTSLDLQHHNKSYAYNRYYCLPTPMGFLFPFQMRREQTGVAITEFKIVEVATGTETDVLALASAGGLEVVQYVSEGYDLVIYPGTLSLGTFNVGRHYLKMSDTSNTWYSEVFNFVDTTAGLVKVEWWHDGDFCYPSGKIRYNYPYKGRVYLKTDIGKPEYPFEQEVTSRNGKNFKLKQVSSKLYKFLFLAPEYLIDAFRQIPLHDFVEVTNYNDNRTYTVDEINMQSPEWLDNGDVASVTVDFQTDTVIVKSGSGVTTLDYTLTPGDCLPTSFDAVAEIAENSIQYNGYYYTSEADGSNVDFVNGDYVLITDIASPYKRKLYQYNSGAYNLIGPTDDQVVYDANSGKYYFYDTDQFIEPVIDSISAGTLTGKTFPNTLAAIYSYDGSTATLLSTVLASEIEAGTSITVPGGSEFVYFVVITPACPTLATSNYYRTGVGNIGVGYDTIESDLIVY